MFQLGNLFNYLLSMPLGTKRHYGIITTVTAFIAMVILVRIMVNLLCYISYKITIIGKMSSSWLKFSYILV